MLVTSVSVAEAKDKDSKINVGVWAGMYSSHPHHSHPKLLGLGEIEEQVGMGGYSSHAPWQLSRLDVWKNNYHDIRPLRFQWATQYKSLTWNLQPRTSWDYKYWNSSLRHVLSGEYNQNDWVKKSKTQAVKRFEPASEQKKFHLFGGTLTLSNSCVDKTSTVTVEENNSYKSTSYPHYLCLPTFSYVHYMH